MIKKPRERVLDAQFQCLFTTLGGQYRRILIEQQNSIE